MSKLSIYKNSWINLVFEGRNKNYGAYQLRKESDEISLMAFCLGLFFVATLTTIPAIIGYFHEIETQKTVTPDLTNTVVLLSNVEINQPIKKQKSLLPIKKKPITEVTEKKQLINPIIVEASKSNTTIATNSENKLTTTVVEGNESASKSNATGSAIVESKSLVDDKVNSLNSLDKLPEYPGGINKFYTYVGNNFEKLEAEETFKIVLSFVIEKDGSMSDIKVINNSGKIEDKVAIRILKALQTKWKPGSKDGLPVRTLYTLPIKVNKFN